MRRPTEPIPVLHVDDDADFADLTAALLERADDRLEVATATSAREGLERLAACDVDCIVSDYEMPGRNGIELLESVRRDHPDLPFILFTGRGSEEVASDAISAGVTDYLQKGAGTDQYEILANRIGNAVDRWRAEERAELWTRALETANEGIAIVDARGRHVEVNGVYAELPRGTPGELIGEPWTTAGPDREVTRLLEEVIPELAAGEGWSGESVGRRLDGTEFRRLLSWSPLDDGGFVCFVRDVTEERAREAELRRNDATLSVLFGQSPDMISVHDAEGTLVDVNDRICEELGYDEAELLDVPVWELDADLTRECGLELWAEMETGEMVGLEVTFRRRDGSTFPVEVNFTKIEFDGRARFFVISRNITDRRERERTLERQNERLEEFASIVSHDLRNPLYGAAGHLELARDECESRHLDAVERSHERMQSLVRDLLTLAREGDAVTAPESVDIAAAVRRCWETSETGDATLTVEASRAVPADPSRLRRLFENLVTNAVEHGGDGVAVRVGALGDGFYVEDDGRGIAAADRDRVFERGYSSDATGVGYGLHIVEQIVAAHGWTIRVAESADGGARFEIRGVESR